MARGADGARVVIAEAAVITATLGSRLSTYLGAGEAVPIVKLHEGGFSIYVGSTPVVFDLDGISLAVQRAQLLVARIDGVWIAKVLSRLEGGKARLSVSPTPLPAAQPPDLLAPLQALEYEIPQGSACSLKAARILETDLKSSERRFDDLDTRLTASPGGPLLAPVNMEEVDEIAAQQTDVDEAVQNIEIEDIEIEVGCVEICVD